MQQGVPQTAAPEVDLESLRKQFREELSGIARPPKFHSRIGVVLSGGGARGAYEAGALMAFQDAEVPTHIIAASSIGSINAASYAADSAGYVGRAENMVKSWLELTPALLGIDWSRYIFILAGLVAASAGIGNFIWGWLQDHGIYLHATHPQLSWLSLAAAGIAILFFSDRLSYFGHLALNLLRRRRWAVDSRKASISMAANFLVWGFVIIFLSSSHVHIPLDGSTVIEFSAPWPIAGAVVLIWALRKIFRTRLSNLSHRFLRLPLRTGLFPNFERAKFLRSCISEKGLRNSPIRVLMTATNLKDGSARYFSNVSPQEILDDPNVQKEFVMNDVECPPDLVQAAVASSSYTFAYEAVPMEGRLWTDGGIVSIQPIRPAIRMGADVLFLVMVSPIEGEEHPGEIKTFLDVGIHAWDILITKNFKTDVLMLSHVNNLCSIYAAEIGVQPEQLELQIGNQKFRYVKAFNIAPPQPLPVTVLDFEAALVQPLIGQGYVDAVKVIKEFFQYECARPARESRRVVRLSAERLEGNFRVTGNRGIGT
jgi:predicted acylesterase/phospholipase RssA